MPAGMKTILVAAGAVMALSACSGPVNERASDGTKAATPDIIDARTVEIPHDGFNDGLLTALITAKEGDVIIMPAGTYAFSDGLSLDVNNVSLRGAGENETILDFAAQSGAGEGLLVTSANVTLEGFTIRDTAGDGIKTKGADNIIYRDLTVEWPGEPDESNGAYGVYPVESKNVLIDGVTVRGASDAGIYVGQSENIIVRNSIAEYNVAGIEIENSTHADVYDNSARHNAGGILVFDLPDLPIIGGHSTRIFNNQVLENNTRNFAPPGNIVASVPSGTGLLIMANENVHVFGNQFENNRTAHVIITAYQDAFDDERYNPLPRNIVVRDNRYGVGGNDPQGLLGEFAQAIGGRMPPIVWDGVTSWPGTDPVDVNLTVNEASLATSSKITARHMSLSRPIRTLLTMSDIIPCRVISWCGTIAMASAEMTRKDCWESLRKRLEGGCRQSSGMGLQAGRGQTRWMSI